MTSRRRPRVLDARVVVEPIHALSLAEAVLLARELPNLGGLFDGTAGVDVAVGRSLVARTLGVVQGHPKLIELADGLAADPTSLEQRLGEADQAWALTGTRLDVFFERGESAAAEDDYLRVLNGWTRAAVGLLPEASAVLFQFLCAVEEDDRSDPAVGSVWPHLWQRLKRPGEPPDWHAALGPLVAHGLVDVETGPDQPTLYRLHPGVAAAGRAAAGPGLQAAVDTELAAYWVTGLDHAVEREGQELGWLVLRAGRAAVPYLLRLPAWDTAGRMLEEVLNRDRSPGTVVALLPLLRRIADATAGTDQELCHVRNLARALATIRPAEAETQLRNLVDTAVGRGCFDTASAAAGDLMNLLRHGGRLSEALALVDQMKGYTRRAGLGPWTQLLLSLGRLGDAKALLLDCRQVFEDERYVAGLGRVLSALADLEGELGHTDSAVRLGQDALRLKYAAGDPDDITVSHFNLANHLQRAGQDSAVAVAHRLASAMIWLQIGSGQIALALRALVRDLAGFDGDPPLPTSFAELCHLVDQTDGVHLAQLVERLPKQAPDGDKALAEVLRLAGRCG